MLLRLETSSVIEASGSEAEKDIVLIYIMWIDASVCDVYREKHFYLTALFEGKKLMVRMPSCETFFFSWSELGSILIVQEHLYATCYTTSCTTSFGIIQLNNPPYYIDRTVL